VQQPCFGAIVRRWSNLTASKRQRQSVNVWEKKFLWCYCHTKSHTAAFDIDVEWQIIHMLHCISRSQNLLKLITHYSKTNKRSFHNMQLNPIRQCRIGGDTDTIQQWCPPLCWLCRRQLIPNIGTSLSDYVDQQP
jgi:hypothetical protein